MPARARQVEALLISIRLPVSKLIDTVRSCDPNKVLTPQHITQMRVTVPTSAETMALLPYKSRADLRALPKPDRYFGEILHTQRFQDKLNCIHTRKTFEWDHRDLDQDTTCLLDEAQQLDGCLRFGEVVKQLQVLLQARDGSSAQRSVYDVLTDAAQDVSLLEGWCVSARQSPGGLLGLPEDLRLVQQAAALNVSQLERRFRELKEAVTKVGQEVDHLVTGRETLEAFSKEALPVMERLEAKVERLPQAVKQVRKVLQDREISLESALAALSNLLDEMVSARISTASPAPSEPNSPYLSDASLRSAPLSDASDRSSQSRSGRFRPTPRSPYLSDASAHASDA